MRHEIRDKDSLFFTLEVIIGGVPVTGLTPTIAISSVSNNDYWNSVGPAWNGAFVTNNMVELDAVDLPGLYFFDGTAAYDNDNTSADQGYVTKMVEPTHNILEYTFIVVSDAMVVDANVIEYLGTGASSTTSGLPDVNVLHYRGNLAGSTISGMPNVNLAAWGGNGPGDVHLSVSATDDFPNVNVHHYADNAAASSQAGLPDTNVVMYKGTAASSIVGSGRPNVNVTHYTANAALSTVAGMPDVNVQHYRDTIAAASVDGMPDVNVMDWNGTDAGGGRHANISAATTPGGTPDDGSGYPHITVATWQNDLSGPQPDNPIYVRYSSAGSGFPGENLPALTVEGWGGDSDATLSVGPTNKFPRITVKAWEGSGWDYGVDGVLSSNDNFVYCSRDEDPRSSNYVIRPDVRAQIVGNNAIDESAFANDAITASVIADNAIDEGAIAIASVTYEEISRTAAREISDAVWSADIFKTLYQDTGTDSIESLNLQPAPDGSMAHAMVIQYLSQNMIHGTTGVSQPGGESSPVHSCNADANGKFYSKRLDSNPLLTAEFASYIDRSVVIVKNFEFSMGSNGMEPTTATWNGVQVYLGRIVGIGSDGSPLKQYFQINLVDEDETVLDFESNKDILIIKAETDSTMHEVAHEVWEEEVADHETKHTFGMFNRIMAGLSQYNHRITDTFYDESGRLKGCRLVVYPSALDAANETNALTTVELTSGYDEKQNMTSFLAKEEGPSSVDPD